MAKQIEQHVSDNRLSSDSASALRSKLGAALRSLGAPLLVKAAAGGGGKGMRIVDEPVVHGNASPTLLEAIATARREAAASFGSPRLLLERYVSRGRHIEVQIFGDTHGNVIHLFEREWCGFCFRWKSSLSHVKRKFNSTTSSKSD